MPPASSPANAPATPPANGPGIAPLSFTAPPEAFVEEVRAALDHLYDSAFLHNHTLAWRLCGDGPAGGLTRAQRLRTHLLDAVEQLRPDGRVPTDDMRAYAILTYRCMDGMTMDEIAAKLGLSRRQAYREYAKAVDAVASLVWDALPPQPGTQPAPPAASQAADLAAAASVSTPPPARPATPPPAEDAGAEDAGEEELPSRLDAAAQEVARLAGNLLLEPVELPLVLENVAGLLAPRLERTGVQLRVAGGTPPPPVLADRALLRQALLNLLSYALDQSCRGGEVTVTWAQEANSAGLRLAACAEGVGAPAAEPEGGAPPVKREGVGVSVAQKLIEAMGGAATVELAAQPGVDSAAWRCALALPAAPRDTVLVVDDNADLTALFQRYAAGQHLTVVGAASGGQAIELARDLRPQLILLDLMLSHMDGWEILQRLRQDAATQTTPIVICSVLNERELAFSLGASDYVTKPISQAALLAVLQRWLGKQHPPA